MNKSTLHTIKEVDEAKEGPISQKDQFVQTDDLSQNDKQNKPKKIQIINVFPKVDHNLNITGRKFASQQKKQTIKIIDHKSKKTTNLTSLRKYVNKCY